MALIEIDGITKTFSELKALDDVTISVDKGEICGFLGPNGAGKSTTIRCIMGFIYPDSGSIVINGQEVKRNNATFLESIGYVSSDLQLNEKWTGQQHFDFVKHTRKLTDDLTKSIDRLSFDVNKRVKYLSSGNKQKLAFLLALLAKPEILILDEPTKGLDPIFQEEMYEMLLEAKSQGKSVFCSSHNLNEVERLCDRIIIIKQGKIVGNETMESIHSKRVYNTNVILTHGSDMETLAKFGEVTSQSSNTISIKIKGDINPFLKALSQVQVLDFSLDHASIEEVFMHYYKDNS